MNSEMDIGRLALSIMEHPELIEKIKKLGTDNGEDAKGPSGSEGGAPHRKGSSRRSALLSSLKPYLNEKRRGAIDTMITVLEVLDAVSTK